MHPWPSIKGGNKPNPSTPTYPHRSRQEGSGRRAQEGAHGRAVVAGGAAPGGGQSRGTVRRRVAPARRRASGLGRRAADSPGLLARLAHGQALARLQDGSFPICALVFRRQWVWHFRASQWRAEAGPSLHRTSRLRRWTVTAAELPTCHRALPMHQRLHTV
jgi:hypothetical protein